MTFGRLLPLRRAVGRAEEFTDEALVAACAMGDSAAMGALFDRFHQRVDRFIVRLLGSDRGTERADLVQATFVEVARCAASYRLGAPVRSWIFGIAANLTRNQIRAIVRRRRMEAGLASIDLEPVARPDAELARRELRTRLTVALADLDHSLREAFVLCEVEELTANEASEVLGVREGTIWRRVHEARKALRAALEAEPASRSAR